MSGNTHSVDPALGRQLLGARSVGNTRARGAAVAILVALALGWALGQEGPLIPLGLAGLVAATWLAYRVPVVASALALLLLGVVAILGMIAHPIIGLTSLGGEVVTGGAGARIEDVLMLGMLLASMARLATPAGRKLMGRMLYPAVALGVWMVFEVVRNLFAVGFQALGEFRYQYLMVFSIPLSLVLGLSTPKLVAQALKWFCAVAVGVPLLLIPILLTPGGSIGGGRLFPSHVSLGVLLGLTVLWRCRSVVRWPRVLLWSATVIGLIEILFDAHRSVWLAALAIGFAIMVADRKPKRAVQLVVGALLPVGVAILTATYLGIDVLSIVADRSQAALGMQDTAAWRWYLWVANLRLFGESPWIGRGLGLYFYNTYIPELGLTVDVFPHNMYVMALVHLGSVGLGLLGWLWYSTLSHLRSAGRALAEADKEWGGVVGVGIASLVAGAAYSVAYGFDPFSLTLVGICLAVAVRWRQYAGSAGAAT